MTLTCKHLGLNVRAERNIQFNKFEITEIRYGRTYKGTIKIEIPNNKFCLWFCCSNIWIICLLGVIIAAGIAGYAVSGDCFKADITGTEFNVTYNDVEFYTMTGDYDKKCIKNSNDITKYENVYCNNVTSTIGEEMLAQMNVSLNSSELIDFSLNYSFGRVNVICVTHKGYCDEGHGLPVRVIPVTVEANYSLSINNGKSYNTSCFMSDFDEPSRNRYRCNGDDVIQTFYNNDAWTPRAIYDEKYGYINEVCPRLFTAMWILGSFTVVAFGIHYYLFHYQKPTVKQIQNALNQYHDYQEFKKRNKIIDSIHSVKLREIEEQLKKLRHISNDCNRIDINYTNMMKERNLNCELIYNFNSEIYKLAAENYYSISNIPGGPSI